MRDFIKKIWFWIKVFVIGLPKSSKIERSYHKDLETRKITNKKKLDCKVIIWCRDQYRKGESIGSLADKMGVNTTTLSRAMSGKTYKKCKGK
jgi:DNA-binding transcriptional regulator YiaG